MSVVSTLLASIFIDRVAGEPRRWHPLVGFGKLANIIDLALHPGVSANETAINTRVKGAAAVLLLIAPFVGAAATLSQQRTIGKLFDVAVLYLSIGSTSLRQHAEAVLAALENDDLEQARICVGQIVSRDTGSLGHADIVRATIESVLENGNDAIFAPLFWFMLCGAPGVVLYRLANTLDAMWGYRNDRYLHFGWAAARLDDLLNLIPARLTALTYTLLGSRRSAWRCWHNQGALWYSPNAGPVMAAGAGALEIKLGGPAVYHGKTKERPVLGTGSAPEASDISSALAIIDKGLLLWLALSILGPWVLEGLRDA